MADVQHKTLIVPHLFGPEGYWKTLDWQKSFEKGMKAAELPYSGEFTWVETVSCAGASTMRSCLPRTPWAVPNATSP